MRLLQMIPEQFILPVCMLIIHSNAQQFTVQPESVVQAEGLEAVFECRYQTSVPAYGWVIDGSVLDLPAFGVVATNPSADSPIAKLTINATSQYYNDSVVQCRAFDDERGNPLSKSATLKIQGIKRPTIQSSVNAITISWENPFTTHLEFCVDAKSVGSSEAIAMVCIDRTQYTFTSLDSDLCEELSFTITPADRVRKGTASPPVTGYFQGKRVVDIIRCQQAKDVSCEVTFSTPLNCTCELIFSSIDAEELAPITEPLTVKGNGGSSYNLSRGVLPNRHYSVEIIVNNQYELPGQNISTHDIVEASAVSSSLDGAVSTTCTFVQNTTAKGYLAVISDLSCVSKTVFIAEYNTAGTHDITEGVGRGNYQVAFFDLENGGLIALSNNNSISGSARMTKVNISGGPRDQQNLGTTDLLREAVINTAESQVCTFCSSEVDCLVLMYDCTHPDLLVSLFVPANGTNCTRVRSQLHSIAYFGINMTNGLLLGRYPGKVNFVDMDQSQGGSSATGLSTLTSAATMLTIPNSTTTEVESSLPMIAAITAAVGGTGAVTLLVVLCFGVIYKIRRKRAFETKHRAYAIPTETECNVYLGSVKPVSLNKLNFSEHWQNAVDHEHTATEDLENDPEFDIPDPTYATADTKRVMVKKGTRDKELVDSAADQSPYVEIAGHQHEAQVYAHVTIGKTQQGVPRNELDVLQVQYAVLDHSKLVDKEDSTEVQTGPEETTSSTPPKPTPLNTDALHTFLIPATTNWYEIGLAMGFSRDTLEDVVYPGNSTDWLRLREVCGLYCEYKHSWEEVVRIMWTVEEWEIADSICRQERLQVEHPVTGGVPSPPSLPPKPPDKTLRL